MKSVLKVKIKHLSRQKWIHHSLAAVVGLIAVCVQTCQASAQSTPGFDVDDVAILFAFENSNLAAQTAGPQPSVSLGGPTPLLGPTLFKQIESSVDSLTAQQVHTHFPYETWRIFALRYDPCFAKPKQTSVESAGECYEQIRLIAQPSTPRAEDVAMHLLYRIQPHRADAQSPVIAELKALRDLSKSLGSITIGVPLKPYPGLTHTESSTAIAQALEKLIHRHCSQANLVEVTFTDSEVQENGPWFFTGGQVHEGKWAPEPIPLLANGALVQATDDSGTVDLLPKSAMSRTDVAGLFSIMTPELSNPRNTDCASCHLQAIALTTFPGISFASFANHAHLRDILHHDDEIGLTAFVERVYMPQTPSDVRLFGYAGASPLIGPLTARSAAAVAAQVNQIMKWSNPSGRDCSNPEVLDCFAAIGTWKDKAGAGEAPTCLNLCVHTGASPK